MGAQPIRRQRKGKRRGFRRPARPAGVALLLAVGAVSACSGEERGSPEPSGEREPRAEAPAPGGKLQEPEVLLRETSSGIAERRRKVLRTPEEWEAFWREAHSGRVPTPERPPVDFGERVVVVAAMGERPTGGFSIEIEEVRASEEGYRVVVLETSPADGCLLTQALTQPVTAVAVPDGEVEVSFEEREEVREC